MFGDVSKLISKLGDKLTEQQVLDLLSQGTEEEFYDAQNVWCYFCVEPGSFRNYMFAPMDSENRDNKYDLFAYQDTVEDNLINKIMDNLNIFLKRKG